MKQILEPDKKILNLIRQSVPSAGTEMKLSQYAVKYELSGKTVCFHTLSGECVLMEGNEELPQSFICEEKQSTYDDLIHHRFYVQKDVNEIETYCSLLSILRTINKSSGIATYTILPTTYCNARCFYCFELGYHFVSMTDEMIDNTISLIEKTHANREIRLIWFGGEPLMGINAIRKITAGLKEKNIAFYSSMVSNGSLFTEHIISEAKENWNLRKIQITLDGNEEEYNRRKNYFDTSVSPFQRVINNIILLLKAGIHVTIRLNVDYDNLASMEELAGRLNELITDRDNLSVYANSLFTEQAGVNSTDIWQKTLNIEKIFRENGFQTPRNRYLYRMRTYHCMADNPSNIVINADGSLYGCEHCQKESRICSLNEIPHKNTKKAVAVSDIDEKCRNCPFLPQCTESISSCPDILYDCQDVRFVKLADTLSKILDQDS